MRRLLSPSLSASLPLSAFNYLTFECFSQLHTNSRIIIIIILTILQLLSITSLITDWSSRAIQGWCEFHHVQAREQRWKEKQNNLIWDQFLKFKLICSVFIFIWQHKTVRNQAAFSVQLYYFKIRTQMTVEQVKLMQNLIVPNVFVLFFTLWININISWICALTCQFIR